MLERRALTLELVCLSWYALMASGLGFKLERWGKLVASRCCSELNWKKTNAWTWSLAFTRFEDGAWTKQIRLVLSHGGSKFYVEFNRSKHVGVFPEQAVHWAWMRAKLERCSHTVNVLILFCYTCAWVGALASNARVTCVDANVGAIQKARANCVLSAKVGVRFVSADAFAYLESCGANAVAFDVIMADPPSVAWAKARRRSMAPKLFEFLLLVDAVCTRRPSLVCLGLYSDKFNSFGVHALVKLAIPNAALIESGVVLIREHANSELGLRTPIAQFVRWTK